MNRNSIFLYISIVFLVAVISVSILFFHFKDMENQQFIEKLQERYFMAYRITRPMMMRRGTNEYFNQLKELELTVIHDPILKQNVLSQGNLISYNKLRHGGFGIIKFQNKYYLHFRRHAGDELFLDNKSVTTDPFYFWFAFTLINLIILSAFIIIIKKLYPLKKLRKEIIRFGEGELNINCKINKMDEIADVANEFDKAITKIRDLTESRALFLRNIMHELKTPITKGKLSIEFIPESRHKEILHQVFNRLELLISEFATVEKVTSHHYSLNMKPYRLIDLVDHAMDLLFINSDKVFIDVAEEKIIVDFDLFSIAIKNLIDNGLSYSSDKRIMIIQTKETLMFISQGKPLDHPIEEYLKPFVTGNHDEQRKHFGLGLYIVNHIVNAHGYSIEHIYQNNENIFIIQFNNHSHKEFLDS